PAQTECALGSFQNQSGASECEEAHVGFYVDQAAATAQAPCPEGNSTTTTGATSVLDCYLDTDLDGMPDLIDDDDDNDGYDDTDDAFPLDPTEWVDTDGDGVGDNADPDDDGDSWTDVEEAISCGDSDPLLSNSTPLDTDGDGLCDPMDPDDDNDFTPDVSDAFPLDACASSDLDGDGMPDGLHPGWTSNLTIDMDDDGDGYNDTDDVFPLDASECCDLDGDGVGDNADPDADNDGWDDVGEVICGYDPLNATSTPPDSDGDGICDPLDSSSGALSDFVNALPGGRTTVVVFLSVASTLGVVFLLGRRNSRSSSDSRDGSYGLDWED
ncbi:MAG: hypothetical protein ACPHIY_00880, partial [Candidatus Thalassarchaeaceae archaeon]